VPRNKSKGFRPVWFDKSVVVGLIIRSRIQSLTALECEYSKPLEEDNGSGAGLVSRAQMPLKLSPRKKGYTRIPPTLADTASRPACHAFEKAYVWRKKQGADAHNKYMKDDQQTNFKEPSHLCITPHSARTRACFLERGAAFFPLVPTAIGRVSVRVRVRGFGLSLPLAHG
jgi:hypothetical protein